MYFSLSCHNCPDVVQALTLMALYNPRITATLIEGGTFQAEVDERGVMAVPATFLNGDDVGQRQDGRRGNPRQARQQCRRRRRPRSWPARSRSKCWSSAAGRPGASAAIYTARKGFRTGIAAERFGGQVLDTLGIENFISVPYTEGPKLAAQLEAHVAEYEIDVMNLQEAAKLVPAQASPAAITKWC